jgi:ectoine hydroxylase-related dioxygenase (phytanoyl-CoA dioxygenase family)
MNLITQPPTSGAELRTALYGGALFLLPATPASRRLVTEASARLETELDGDMRTAQFRLSDEEFFRRVGALRKAFYAEEAFHAHVRCLLAEQGMDVERTAFDPLRLRAVTHRGFENPRAAAVYYAHRDVWYAHDQAEITWWIPLHDVTEEETFVFYPECFARPVPNNSELFDYDVWTQHGAALRIGWQDPTHGQTHLYPGQVGAFDPGRVLSFAASAGEILLFAGAHFHQTRRNSTGRTRYSLDFRSVDLSDHAIGRGAPNVDNRSTGSALRDFVRSGFSSV